MCIYWKKLHTCGHTSDRPYIEMCRSGCLSNTVCSDIGQDDSQEETLRKSHFPCYPCIKNEARAEAEARAKVQHDATLKAQEARENAIRQKQAAEQQAKAERIRREASEKAAKEREEEAKLKAIKEKEDERARKEGGLWIETGSGKKQKPRKGGAYNYHAMPISAPPVLQTFPDTGKKANGGGAKMSPKQENKNTDSSGRAGTWGPKKILSRKENTAMQKD
jgi:hypothetical protein